MTRQDFKDFIRHCREFHPDVHKWYSSEECWMYVTFANMTERKRIDLKNSWAEAIEVMRTAQAILNTQKR
jgi:hypothetical protein